MKRILGILAASVLALACLTASATSTTISGTKTQYPIGFLLSAGQFCFNSACTTLTNGAFSGTFTEATATVTIINAASTQTYLSVPNVVISTTTFNWDSYVVPAGQGISGSGSPTIACAVGATYIQTDALPSNQSWVCQQVAGSNTWVVGPPNAQTTQGISTGFGLYATSHNVSVPANCVAHSGSATAYTCLTYPSFNPAAGDHIQFEADIANTGTATLSVNGNVAATIKKWGGTGNLSPGDLLAAHWISATFDGTFWQLEGQLGNGNQFVSRSRTTAVTTTTILTTSITALYVIEAAVACDTTVATATATLTIQYTDPSSTVQTIAPGAATCTTLGSGSISSTNTVVNAKTGTNITIAVAIANAPTYDVAANVVQLTAN